MSQDDEAPRPEPGAQEPIERVIVCENCGARITLHLSWPWYTGTCPGCRAPFGVHYLFWRIPTMRLVREKGSE